MKTIIATSLIIFLQGCATITPVETCIGYGFKPGTSELADCTMKESQFARKLNRDNWRAFADQMERSNKGWVNPYAKTPTLNCTSRPDYLGGIRTTCN